ncbi:Hypothetical protein NTJ_07137 [Nesidiocoris tenuis]|uniref:Uncharacterized protein n=1 Tax=Nesidiocoris tenuis TaxID=355587 RepID=A0ABN7AQX3_9HEMI|nr:Hypothetical protein NTJ_07137 [Nesidiocoris tenuis]
MQSTPGDWSCTFVYLSNPHCYLPSAPTITRASVCLCISLAVGEYTSAGRAKREEGVGGTRDREREKSGYWGPSLRSDYPSKS